MRESYEAGATTGGDRLRAGEDGKGNHRRAAIMLAVFIAFAGAPIATVSQLGTGLAVAVVLDATVVRISCCRR